MNLKRGCNYLELNMSQTWKVCRQAALSRWYGYLQNRNDHCFGFAIRPHLSRSGMVEVPKNGNQILTCKKGSPSIIKWKMVMMDEEGHMERYPGQKKIRKQRLLKRSERPQLAVSSSALFGKITIRKVVTETLIMMATAIANKFERSDEMTNKRSWMDLKCIMPMTMDDGWRWRGDDQMWWVVDLPQKSYWFNHHTGAGCLIERLRKLMSRLVKNYARAPDLEMTAMNRGRVTAGLIFRGKTWSMTWVQPCILRTKGVLEQLIDRNVLITAICCDGEERQTRKFPTRRQRQNWKIR